jgi:hypothetical protein
MRLSPDPAVGWIQVFRDGRLQVARTPLATMDVVGDQPDPVYLKQGIYRTSLWTVTHVLYFGPISVSTDSPFVLGGPPSSPIPAPTGSSVQPSTSPPAENDTAPPGRRGSANPFPPDPGSRMDPADRAARSLLRQATAEPASLGVKGRILCTGLLKNRSSASETLHARVALVVRRKGKRPDVLPGRGRGSLTLAPHGSAQLRIKLSRRMARVARRHKLVRVRLAVSAMPRSGRRQTRTRTLRIRGRQRPTGA